MIEAIGAACMYCIPEMQPCSMSACLRREQVRRRDEQRQRQRLRPLGQEHAQRRDLHMQTGRRFINAARF